MVGEVLGKVRDISILQSPVNELRLHLRDRARDTFSRHRMGAILLSPHPADRQGVGKGRRDHEARLFTFSAAYGGPTPRRRGDAVEPTADVLRPRESADNAGLLRTVSRAGEAGVRGGDGAIWTNVSMIAQAGT